jgi:hypothetical protein
MDNIKKKSLPNGPFPAGLSYGPFLKAAFQKGISMTSSAGGLLLIHRFRCHISPGGVFIIGIEPSSFRESGIDGLATK